MNRHLMNRRNFLWLGSGMMASVGGAACAKSLHQQSNVYSSANPNNLLAMTELGRSLSDYAASKQLLYGAAVGWSFLSSDQDFAAAVQADCQILVPENDLKWPTLRPTPEQFDFTAGDGLLQFAQAAKMQMRGHTLVWHGALPYWFEEVVNRQNAEQILTQHIQTVAGHYAGKLHSWDVVNEAIHPDDQQPKQFRKTPWFDLLGPEYVDLAFRVAAEADPQALLLYNDYGLEYDTPEHDAKREAVLTLLQDLKARGTPIHAFGMQSHLYGWDTPQSYDKLRQFLADVASLGLKILVTELDVTDRGYPADIETRDRLVAISYEDYLSAVLDEPAVIAVLTWGLSDRYTWLNEFAPRADGLAVRPLPLDENLNRKPAWNAMAQAFEQAPDR